MGTFKSWLIANLEIVYCLLLVLIIVGVALFGDIPKNTWLIVALISLCVFLPAIVGIKHGFIGFLIGGIGSAIWLIPVIVDSNKSTLLIVFAAIAFVTGVLLAIYAYMHFDDVVSRRFLYRNSAVSVFEESWKYAFNRFFAGFILVWGLAMEILVITNAEQLKAFYINEGTKASKGMTVSSSEPEQPEQPKQPEQQERTLPSEVTLRGYLSDDEENFPVDMTLKFEEKGNEFIAKGFYRYQSQPANKRIALNGKYNVESGAISLDSSDGTESFELSFRDGFVSLEGTWYKHDYGDEPEMPSKESSKRKKIHLTVNNQ